MKKKLMALGIATIVGIGAVGTGVYAYNSNSAYKLRVDTFKVELGQEMSLEGSSYITGTDRAIKDTKIDLSKVDTTKVGNYTGTASYEDKSLSFIVQVTDTTAPSVVLANSARFQVVEGQTLSAKDIVSSMSDLSGIAAVQFSEAATVKKGNEDLLSGTTLSYDKEGDYTNKIIVTDSNGNEFKEDISIHVVADYSKHVSGFKDWTVEKDSKVDFTKGIKKDKRIVKITPKIEGVNLSKTGKYTLVYDIVGDDNKTVIHHKVSVNVVKKEEKQEITVEELSSETSSSSSSSKGQTSSSSSSSKEKTSSSSSSSKGKTSSSSSSSKGKTSSSSSSSKGKTSSSSSGSKGKTNSSSGNKKGNSSDGLKPGDVLDFGDPTGSVELNDGGYGYGYDTVTVGK